MRFHSVQLALLAVFVAALAQAQPSSPAVGAKAPDFSLRDASGKRFRLSECLSKQVTVLDFGRFTCPACRTTMTELQKLHQRYAGQGVGIYSVNLDSPGANRKAASSARELGLEFPVLLDTHWAVAKAYGVSTIPHVFVIDPAGIIQFVHVGYQPELPAKLVEVIDKYRPMPKRPKLMVIQGAECVGCGPMPSILKEMKTALVSQLEIELRPYNPDLVDQYELESVPALLFFDVEGKEVYRHEGAMTKGEIIEQLQKMGISVKAD